MPRFHFVVVAPEGALSEAAESIGELLCATLGCDDPFLAELGALRSTDGAPRQPLHADTSRAETPELLTAFIALQVWAELAISRMYACTSMLLARVLRSHSPALIALR